MLTGRDRDHLEFSSGARGKLVPSRSQEAQGAAPDRTKPG